MCVQCDCGKMGSLQEIQDAQVDEYPSVAEFYAGKSIFLTGATGFVGKLFIEKVLRSCPDVAAIYCLVRDKRGKSAMDRVDSICQGQAFEMLRKQCPGFRKKLHVVSGDIQGGQSLGMTDSDVNLICKNVNIIVHTAADITFDQPLKQAIQRNLLPTKALAALARKVEKLEVCVHVSTAYTNCDRLHETLEEQIYPSEIDPQKLIYLTSCLDEDAMEKILPTISGNHPNTYTFTKKLSETLLTQEASDLPLVIVRPTIIVGSQREPMEGFIDQMNGFSTVSIGMGKGVLSKFYTYDDVILDIIPVDHCVNAIITSTWRKAVVEKDCKPTVYHVSTSQQNPFRVSDFVEHGIAANKKWPFENGIGQALPSIPTSSKTKYYLALVFQHLLLGLIMDLFLAVCGRKPRMVTIYLKLIKNTTLLEYFATNSWIWSTKNLQKLQTSLSPCDKKTFYMDAKSIKWSDFIENSTIGLKVYLLKEDMRNVENTRTYYKRLRWIKFLLKWVVIAVTCAVMFSYVF